jgi:hypothetical protein
MGGKRRDLPIPGSPVAGFLGTIGILRMGFQLSTFYFEILRTHLVNIFLIKSNDALLRCIFGQYYYKDISMLMHKELL